MTCLVLAYVAGAATLPGLLVAVVLARQVRALVRGEGEGRRVGYECPACRGLSMAGGPFPSWMPWWLVRRPGRWLARRRHWRAVHGQGGPFPS